MKDKVKDKDTLLYILSKLLIYEGEANELGSDLYSYYYENAAQGLFYSSPITRTKCITIISYLSKVSVEPVLELFERIQILSKDTFWELKGQILILCSNVLIQLNSL